MKLSIYTALESSFDIQKPYILKRKLAINIKLYNFKNTRMVSGDLDSIYYRVIVFFRNDAVLDIKIVHNLVEIKTKFFYNFECLFS